jgi:hypothetical protein
VLEAVVRIEPVAALPDIALVQAPLFVQVVAVVQQQTVAWPALATVPAVLTSVVQPHCCTLVQTAGQKELVAALKKINTT